MHKWIFFGCCLLAALQAAAQTGFKPAADVEGFRKRFAQVSQQTNSIKSDFVQEKALSMLSEKIISKGKFWFRKTDKVRMEYSTPVYYLMVINGKEVRTKDAKKDNRMSVRNNKLFEQISRIVADCVQGNVFDNRDFSTTVLENPQYYRLDMKPVAKNLKDFFSSIELLVNKKDLYVEKIIMHEASGDQTAISFTQKEVNIQIPDELFAVK